MQITLEFDLDLIVWFWSWAILKPIEKPKDETRFDMAQRDFAMPRGICHVASIPSIPELAWNRWLAGACEEHNCRMASG